MTLHYLILLTSILTVVALDFGYRKLFKKKENNRYQRYYDNLKKLSAIFRDNTENGHYTKVDDVIEYINKNEEHHKVNKWEYTCVYQLSNRLPEYMEKVLPKVKNGSGYDCYGVVEYIDAFNDMVEKLHDQLQDEAVQLLLELEKLHTLIYKKVIVL